MLARKEPARLGSAVAAVLHIAIFAGLITLAREDAVFLGLQIDIVWPYLQGAATALIEWVKAEWLRRRVSPSATTEPLAEAVILSKEQNNVTPSPEAVAAARRVLNAQRPA